MPMVSCRGPCVGRPGFITPNLKRSSGCECCWGSCLALPATKLASSPPSSDAKQAFSPLGALSAGQRSAEHLQGAAARTSGWKRLPVSPPRPHRPGAFPARLPGRHRERHRFYGFMVAPHRAASTRCSQHTVPREDEKQAQRGGEGSCQGHTSLRGRDLKPSQAALGPVPSGRDVRASAPGGTGAGGGSRVREPF